LLIDAAKSVTADFVVADALGAALDNFDLSWSSGGPPPWAPLNLATPNGSGDVARSGAVGHNQGSYLRTSVTGPGWVSFWWKVSSEAGFDFLRFYLDAAPKPA
jgi:hypothetical protein